MPLYEIAVVLRSMPKMETASALKRSAESIFNKNGIIRQMEYLGTRETPYKIRAHGTHFKEASYFSIKCYLDTRDIMTIDDEYKRDVDVIKRHFTQLNKIDLRPYACNLHQESLPPAYRTYTQQMIKKGRKCENPYKYKFKYNTGLNYYPFSK